MTKVILILLIFLTLLIFSCKYFEKFNNQDKINFIDKIVWINLDRSRNRKTYMEKLLKCVNVKNERIPAIDGKLIDVENVVKKLNKKKEMSPGEIGCTLSHIKAINSLRNEKGNYFMVCEDDITFDNLKYFNKFNFQKIIESSPEFDILILHKISKRNLDDDFTKWNKKIYSTACYLISKKGVDKMVNSCEYINDLNFKFNNLKKKFYVADNYIYSLLETWVFKYNIINTKDEYSTIHKDHLKYQIKKNKKNNKLIKLNEKIL